MNPRVKVSYEPRWWYWHNVVLENPIIKFWVGAYLGSHSRLSYPIADPLCSPLVPRVPTHTRRLDLGIRRSSERLLHMGRTIHVPARAVSVPPRCDRSDLGSGVDRDGGSHGCIYYTLGAGHLESIVAGDGEASADGRAWAMRTLPRRDQVLANNSAYRERVRAVPHGGDKTWPGRF